MEWIFWIWFGFGIISIILYRIWYKENSCVTYNLFLFTFGFLGFLMVISLKIGSLIRKKNGTNN